MHRRLAFILGSTNAADLVAVWKGEEENGRESLVKAEIYEGVEDRSLNVPKQGNTMVFRFHLNRLPLFEA